MLRKVNLHINMIDRNDFHETASSLYCCHKNRKSFFLSGEAKIDSSYLLSKNNNNNNSNCYYTRLLNFSTFGTCARTHICIYVPKKPIYHNFQPQECYSRVFVCVLLFPPSKTQILRFHPRILYCYNKATLSRSKLTERQFYPTW